MQNIFTIPLLPVGRDIDFLKGNAMNRIITNKIRCKKCGDIIESKHRHDFVVCKCGAVAVDGGHDYLKRTGNYEDWEELSECEDL